MYPFWLEKYPKKIHLRALGSSLSLDYLGKWIKDTHPNILGRSVPIPLKLGKDFESTSIGNLKYETWEGIRFIKNVAVKMAFP